MPEYRIDQIRNIAIAGHCGSGKSSLIEALLYSAGAINTRGRVDKGTNHADFTPQEKAHHHSLEASFLSLDHRQRHINIIDTPGLPDFFGRIQQVLPAVEGVVLVVNASRGIEPITKRVFEEARQQGKSIAIAINKIDCPQAQVESVLEKIQLYFGIGCLPMNLPREDGNGVVDCFFQPEWQQPTAFGDIDHCNEAVISQIVEQDEELLMRHLEGDQPIRRSEMQQPLAKAMRQGEMIPICFTSAEKDLGINQLLDIMAEVMPSPVEANPPQFINGWGEDARDITISMDEDAHLIAHVFRIAIDPYVGRIGVFRIYQGTIETGQKMFIDDNRKAYKITQLFKLQGEHQRKIERAQSGDICAIAKIDELEVGAILHDNHAEDNFHLAELQMSQPLYSLAVRPKRRGDEKKLADVLKKLVSEDPSLQITRARAENETVLQGLGDMHVQIALEKARDVFNLETDTQRPAVAYRETINSTGRSRYRHKKQTGGAGQFGEVELRVEPLARGSGFQFASEVTGGAIPSQYLPSIEKGIKEAMAEGVVAGFPMQDIRVVVEDGKHHSVDSKDIAFFTAGKKAFQDAISQANPVILEPIVDMHVQVPQDKMGDITGDLSAHRAMVCGTEAMDDSQVDINAEAPLAALDDYATRLKVMTGGEGQLTMAFSRYEIVPPNVQQRLMQH